MHIGSQQDASQEGQGNPEQGHEGYSVQPSLQKALEAYPVFC
jgi:hypothetical protein